MFFIILWHARNNNRKQKIYKLIIMSLILHHGVVTEFGGHFIEYC